MRSNRSVTLGIVPRRLPVLTWRKGRSPDPGYAIRDIDPLTGQGDLRPYNSTPTDPNQVLTAAHRACAHREGFALPHSTSTATAASERDGDSTAASGREVFSNSLVADAAKGIASLAWVDGNADGVIDARDPVFAQLRVWQDADGDARPDAAELQTLQALGITALDYANARFTRNGQPFALQTVQLEANP